MLFFRVFLEYFLRKSDGKMTASGFLSVVSHRACWNSAAVFRLSAAPDKIRTEKWPLGSELLAFIRISHAIKPKRRTINLI